MTARESNLLTLAVVTLIYAAIFSVLFTNAGPDIMVLLDPRW